LIEKLADKGMDELSDLPGMSYLNDYDLQNMIEDARNLAKQGLVEAATESLNELKALLESIEAAMNSDVPVNQFTEARKLMDDLNQLSREQEDVLDETFRQVRKMRNQSNDENSTSEEDSPEQSIKEYATQQESIRDQLGKMMSDIEAFFGGRPETLVTAESSMVTSRDLLSVGDGENSLPYQGQALEALRQTTEFIAQQLANQMRALPGVMPTMQGTLPIFGEDPFGRSGTGGIGSQMDDGMVRLPDQMEMHRIREIFNELKRRAGEYTRPEIERNYIDRLLRQF